MVYIFRGELLNFQGVQVWRVYNTTKVATKDSALESSPPNPCSAKIRPHPQHHTASRNMMPYPTPIRPILPPALGQSNVMSTFHNVRFALVAKFSHLGVHQLSSLSISDAPKIALWSTLLGSCPV